MELKLSTVEQAIFKARDVRAMFALANIATQIADELRLDESKRKRFFTNCGLRTLAEREAVVPSVR